MRKKEDKIILDERKIIHKNGSITIDRHRRLPKEDLTKVIMIRVKTTSFKELKKIAEKECRTIASIVRQAIKEYLEKK